MKLSKSFKTGNSDNQRAGRRTVLLFSLLVALLLSAATYVDSAEAELPSIVSIGDVNNSGSPEVSVLMRDTVNSKNYAYVLDTGDGLQVKRLEFDAALTPLFQTALPDMDSNGVNEIAMLGVGPAGYLKVIVKDAETGDKIGSTILFNKEYTPLAMSVLPDIDGNGFPEIAVLGVRASDGKVEVLIKDAETGVKTGTPIGFDKNFPPIAMAVVPDVNGNGADELAVLGVGSSGGYVKVTVKDSLTGALINSVSFDRNFPPVAVAVVPDIDGSGISEIAVLGVRSSDGKVQVTIKDAETGSFINNFAFDKDYSPVAMVVVPDMDGNGADEIAMMGVAGDGRVRVIIKDASNNGRISNFYYYTDYPPVSMAVVPNINGNSASEIALLSDVGNGYLEVSIKNSDDAELIKNLFLPDDDNGNDCNSATPVDNNSSLGALLEYGRDFDYFRIEIPSSGLLNVYTTGSTNTTGYLKDSSCTTITSTPNYVDGSNFSITYSVNAGTYYVAVKNGSSFGTGAYTLNVEFVITTPFTGVTGIAAGTKHSMAVKTDGTVWAWGDNGYGQLGDGGATTYSYVPVQVCAEGETAPCSSFLTGVTAIATGLGYSNGYHSIALKTDGSVWAWGSNYHGTLGDGTTTTSYVPVQVCAGGETVPCSNFLTGVTEVVSGMLHNMALKSDGTVWTWGGNSYGQLGDGTGGDGTPNNDSSVPVLVSGLTGVTGIAAGTNHSLAVKTDGSVWAWGYSEYGTLGNGTTTFSSSVPVQVCAEGETAPCSAFLTGVTAISAGMYYSTALKTDGTVWAWGWNRYYQLGNTTSEHCNIEDCSTTPIQVCAEGETIPCSSFLTGVTGIDAGVYHGMAVKTGGTVWAWGRNDYGQFGDGGATTYLYVPVQVCAEGETYPCSSWLTGVTEVASGRYHSMALKPDGTVWSWGAGALGNGTNISSLVPVQVMNDPW